MLKDELYELLKSIEPDFKAIETYWQSSNSEKRLNSLEEASNSEEFWKDPKQIEISKELQSLKLLCDEYSFIKSAYADNTDLLEIIESEDELKVIKSDIESLCRRTKKFKIALLLNKEDDKKSCFLNITPGAGGTESQDWADILLRMYLRFCEREKLKASILDYQPGEEAGLKSATLFVKGKNAYGLLKGESGVHRLVRISPFDSNKRRHTSFCGINVTPEAEEAKIEVNPDDLRIDTYRAGGKGGQHVNKTDSAVRITHIPTKIVVQCQSERSQHQNKETCMKMLKAKLLEKQREKQKAKDASVEKKKIEWGSQIRSYILHPYKMVKDHRTNKESPQPNLVLDGDLIGFIENYLATQK